MADAIIRSTGYLISDVQNLIQNMDIGIVISKPQSRGNSMYKNNERIENMIFFANKIFKIQFILEFKKI
jgi:hypothetical protein